VKLPALWLALAFASGIVAEEIPGTHWQIWAAAASALIATGLLLALAWKRKSAAWIFALAAWFALGGLAMQMQQRNVAADDVARLIGAGKIDARVPLHWRGTLREDPERLPWGVRYTISLAQVEALGHTSPAQGGLRLTYYHERGDAALSNFRAGDRVEALCQARIPRNYADPGVFDERAFLKRQNIDLIGTLRSS